MYDLLWQDTSQGYFFSWPAMRLHCQDLWRIWDSYTPFPTVKTSDGWLVIGLKSKGDTMGLTLLYLDSTLQVKRQLWSNGDIGEIIAAGWYPLYFQGKWIVPCIALRSYYSPSVFYLFTLEDSALLWARSVSYNALNLLDSGNELTDVKALLQRRGDVIDLVLFVRLWTTENEFLCDSRALHLVFDSLGNVLTHHVWYSNPVGTSIIGDHISDILPYAGGYFAIFGGNWGPSWGFVDSTFQITQWYHFSHSYKDTIMQLAHCGTCTQGRWKRIVTAKDGYLLLGYTPYYSSNDMDVLVMRLDSSFMPLWSSVIIGNGTTIPYDGFSMGDSLYFVVGMQIDSSSSGFNGFIACLDNMGHLRWLRLFPQTKVISQVFSYKDTLLLLVGVTQSDALWMAVIDKNGFSSCSACASVPIKAAAVYPSIIPVQENENTWTLDTTNFSLTVLPTNAVINTISGTINTYCP